ncbi:hypothetical protein SEA_THREERNGTARJAY_42 [Mycobacterium phage ThreeRngTarjay]|nr:hypothetical protein SEA_HALLEY_44 [Mycobacterium phage Halley]AXQ52280.1 hypothetical protein SEA_ERICMILLARD_44 [Mycobacterium phage EricMillard]AYB69531.1 hypothetical protein SEA_KALAH2_44 [Mycobacterium phage Kalah2]QBI99681.1 hypothetical protein SEA_THREERNGTARJAY_42 [Mycobacterium phage ThreeRngTarjay]QBI99993.1 hypothetical protein SEA_PHOEBUS_43 [Mycobacterium phage Phoebus]QZD97917.1 hypothetical protein SEA_BEEM_44 [Mycobacterium phage Beem]
MLYRTLFPVSYQSGNKVVHITRPGVVIDLDAVQAESLFGRVVYVGDSMAFPRAEVVYYDSFEAFPPVGDERYVFLARDTGSLYQWSHDDGYTAVVVGADVIVDEDDMASNAADKAPSQQSVKAYVDAGLSGKAATSHAHTASSITDGVRTVIVSTGSEARPSTTGTVLWLGGSSEPTNYDDTKDIWFGTD